MICLEEGYNRHSYIRSSIRGIVMIRFIYFTDECPVVQFISHLTLCERLRKESSCTRKIKKEDLIHISYDEYKEGLTPGMSYTELINAIIAQEVV